MNTEATIGLDEATASRFDALALENIAREYPHKLDHVIGSDADVVAPRKLHPAFHGSFDWHSCVHMHWLLVRLLGEHPSEIDAAAARTTLDATLTLPAL